MRCLSVHSPCLHTKKNYAHLNRVSSFRLRHLFRVCIVLLNNLKNKYIGERRYGEHRENTYLYTFEQQTAQTMHGQIERRGNLISEATRLLFTVHGSCTDIGGAP